LITCLELRRVHTSTVRAAGSPMVDSGEAVNLSIKGTKK